MTDFSRSSGIGGCSLIHSLNRRGGGSDKPDVPASGSQLDLRESEVISGRLPYLGAEDGKRGKHFRLCRLILVNDWPRNGISTRSAEICRHRERRADHLEH